MKNGRTLKAALCTKARIHSAAATRCRRNSKAAPARVKELEAEAAIVLRSYQAMQDRLEAAQRQLGDRDRQLIDRDKRITELEATLPPPLTEAELAELTRSSEKLWSAEARVKELEASNGYPLAAEWRGKCEAALAESNHYKTWHHELQSQCVQQQAQLAEAREILETVAAKWTNELDCRYLNPEIKSYLARTAPASDKPEPPAQERKGDSHTSVRQELHDVKSPGSESVTTAAGPKCPMCGAPSIDRNDPASENHGTMDEAWSCGSYKPYRSPFDQTETCKQKTAAGAERVPDKGNVEGIETSEQESSLPAAAGPKTERCPHCNCSSIHKEQDRDDEGNVTNEWAECLYCGEQWSWQDKQKTAAGDTSEVSETREGSPSLDVGAKGTPAAAELPKRSAEISVFMDQFYGDEFVPTIAESALWKLAKQVEQLAAEVEKMRMASKQD